MSGGGGHVVVVVAGDGEVVDGFGSSGGLDRHHLGDLAVGGVEGVALVEVRGRCVAAALDVERVGGRGLDGAAGGGHPQSRNFLMNKGLFHGGGFVLAGGGVVGEDLLAGLDLADGFGGAVGHEDGGVGCEAAVPGDADDGVVRGLLVVAQVVLGHGPQPGRVGQPDRVVTRVRVRVGRPRGPGDGFEGIDRQERPRGGVVDPGAPSS